MSRLPSSMNIMVTTENKEGETQDLVGRPKKRKAEDMSEDVTKESEESEEPVAKRMRARPTKSAKGRRTKKNKGAVAPGEKKKKVKKLAGSTNKVKNPADSGATLLVSPTAAAPSSSLKAPATFSSSTAVVHSVLRVVIKGMPDGSIWMSKMLNSGRNKQPRLLRSVLEHMMAVLNDFDVVGVRKGPLIGDTRSVLKKKSPLPFSAAGDPNLSLT
ncbi:hypothetical protein BDK51DRAFT_52039 [Blyttiomyces helicus]|uniref:Uncharacterized protein n=1 Tax=Blyttiomyces helicus TaxID=388810 RepID=A0A4P9WKN3_9FUNG|nr:hypothetical protein BDK51DRAFT_52039 [Blyttiomyces helicus]|eukprot:RKO91730.1 hypothetical protein BDK51DRAFT_52039 [Blyttiomyces helicus]